MYQNRSNVRKNFKKYVNLIIRINVHLVLQLVDVRIIHNFGKTVNPVQLSVIFPMDNLINLQWKKLIISANLEIFWSKLMIIKKFGLDCMENHPYHKVEDLN